jgi:riboflavin synthase
MFTGLVETTGVLRRRAGSPVARAFIEASLGELVLGESIDVNGACLTVDRIAQGGFECDMTSETLARSTLGDLPLGTRVHLERATPLGGRMGGHVVLGHVDGVGRVSAREPRGDAIRLEVTLDGALARYLAPKGSVAVDGVSLTVNGVRDEGASTNHPAVAFDVMLVPHTLGRTLLGELRMGSRVNIEVDVLARYVARQLGFRGGEGAAAGGEAGGPEGASADNAQRLLTKLRTGGFL